MLSEVFIEDNFLVDGLYLTAADAAPPTAAAATTTTTSTTSTATTLEVRLYLDSTSTLATLGRTVETRRGPVLCMCLAASAKQLQVVWQSVSPVEAKKLPFHALSYHACKAVSV